jgi:hypothetical protein
MRSSTKTVAMTICLYLILGLVGASEYQFGTKVLAGDKDIGRPLFAMPLGTDIRFWDTGAPGYDDSDVVYLSPPPVTNIKANDVRLTPFGNYPAGSKVASFDIDNGMPLIAPIPGLRAIRYLNLFGSSNYDLRDPVYVSQSPAISFVNDVRLNATPGTGLEPGTKVRDFDPDLNKFMWLFPNPLVTLPHLGNSLLGFFDVNGNGVYDYWDDVYMNFPQGVPAGSVTVNNVRLSGPV